MLAVPVRLIVPEAGRLGSRSRIDVSTQPPTVSAVEYELPAELRDDIVACEPVVFVGERLAVRLESAGFRGFELVPADTLPGPRELDEDDDSFEPLPEGAPTRYRWVRETEDDAPDLRVLGPCWIEVSDRLMQHLESASLADTEVDDDPRPARAQASVADRERAVGWVSFHSGFAGEISAVEGVLDGVDERAEFATMSQGVEWARARTGRVIAQTDGARFSVGRERITDLPELTADELRLLDEEVLVARQRILAEAMVHAESRPWYLVIYKPDVETDIDRAERAVRSLPGVVALTSRTSSGDLVWVIEVHGRSERDVQDVDGAIARALWPDDRLARTFGEEGFFSFGSGEEQRIGLFEHLDRCQFVRD